MRRLLSISSAVIIVAACYHGPAVGKFRPAQAPNGIAADLTLRETDVSGELLAVQDSALIVLTTLGKIVLAPAAAIQRGQFGQLGVLLGPGENRQQALERLRYFSRFPSGLTPDLRTRLLAAYGQTEIQVLQ